jgi:coenzyme PQQ biosynthesis protein PqqD
MSDPNETTPPKQITPNSIPRLSPRARMQTDKVSGKPVLISQESVLILNATGSDILTLCDGTRTVSEIAAKLAGDYSAQQDTIAANVGAYLMKLQQLNLVSWQV